MMESKEKTWQTELDFSAMEDVLGQMKYALSLVKQEHQKKYDELLRQKIQRMKNGLGEKRV